MQRMYWEEGVSCCHVEPPGGVSIQKHRPLAHLKCPSPQAHHLLPGLLIPRTTRVKVQGLGFLCCPANPLHLARATSVPPPPPGEFSLMPRAGRPSTTPSWGDFPEPWQEAEKFCLHICPLPSRFHDMGGVLHYPRW